MNPVKGSGWNPLGAWTGPDWTMASLPWINHARDVLVGYQGGR